MSSKLSLFSGGGYPSCAGYVSICVAFTEAHTGDPSVRPSSASETAVISAVTGTGSSTSTRTRSPMRWISLTRVGHVFRGLPAGRPGYRAMLWGAMTTKTSPVVGLAASRVAPLARVRVVPRARALSRLRPIRPAMYVVRGRVVTSFRVPCWASLPASMMTSRSAMAAASRGSWVTSTHDPVNSARWRRSWWRTDPRVPRSRAAMGSSSRRSRAGLTAPAP